MKSKKALFYASIFVLLVVGIGLSAITWSAGLDKNDANAKVRQAITVKTQKVETQNFVTKLSFKATLEPVEEGLVSSKLSGKVVQVFFENGKSVSQGDPLIKLDDQDIRNQLQSARTQLQASQSQLQASIAGVPKVRANLENTQLKYSSMKSLFEQGAVTKFEFDNAKASLEAANSDLSSTLANLNTLRANVSSGEANIDSLNDSLANTVVKAPISGIMDGKSVNVGQFVSPGPALAEVKNVSIMNAVIQVEQNDLKYIKLGQKAQIKLDEGGKVYAGIVKNINLSANPSARNFDCKIEVNNKAQALRPGIFAKAEISKGDPIQSTAVPLVALMGDDGNYFVFVAEKGTARKKTVSVGEIKKDVAQIKSGLQPGAQIIVTNLNTLQDGDPVTVTGQGE